MNREPLPDRLHSGDRIRIGSGVICMLKGTGDYDKYDEPVFRLQYPPRKINGWRMPGVQGNGRYSRDDLNAMGVELMVIRKEPA